MDKNTLLDCWNMFRREHQNISVDRMICDPILRQAFIDSAGNLFGDASEKKILWTLMGLRKGKKLLRISAPTDTR